MDGAVSCEKIQKMRESVSLHLHQIKVLTLTAKKVTVTLTGQKTNKNNFQHKFREWIP